jgi:tetratricopeptide (TPR) repeat protein
VPTIGRMPISHGGRAAHARLQHDMFPQETTQAHPAKNHASVEVEDLFAKERYKEAVKQAKLCFSAASTPENHRLLERAYCLRGRQLIEFGMASSAVEVARHLLELGVTGGEHVTEIVRLLIDLGLREEAFETQERLGTPEMRNKLVVMEADRAVIDPDGSHDESGEVARDARLIRESLARLQARDEPGALLLLRDLPRSSVLSEWKFFVRGLAAYYRGETAEVKANWDRLDTARKAHLIAQRLLSFLDVDGADPGSERIKALEKLAYREPILHRLQELTSRLANQEWDKIFSLLGSLRQSLRRIDRKLAERLTLALSPSVMREAASVHPADARRLMSGFIRVAEPTAIDPRWSRLWAIMWDLSGELEPSESLECWGRYLEDLKSITALGDDERSLAQAMVWNRMAKLAREMVAEPDDDDDDRPFGLPMSVRPRSEPNALRELAAKERVVDCLEKSLALAPYYRPTYELLVEVYRSWDATDSLVASARRLLEKFPDDLDTLTLLANHYAKNDDPAAALPLVEQARVLKPLDESLRQLEWTIRVDLARSHALLKRWNQGRAEFVTAENLIPDSKANYHYLAQKVMFEAKAGERDLSDGYLEQAVACLKEPTPLWLALAIESIRYRMTKATKEGYTKMWESALKLKRHGETGGLMAALLDGLCKAGVEYPGRATHIKKVSAYVGPGSRLKYRQIDIESICEFLFHANQKAATIEKLVAVGLKQFPRSAQLNFRAATLETGKALFGFGNPRTRKYLDTALKLAEASTDPNETALVSPIKKALTFLNETDKMPLGFRSFGAGSAGFPFGGFADYFDDWDDDNDEDDDEYYDDDYEPPQSQRARPTSQARKAKRRKRR